MHLFLTGEKQAGKSTLLRKLLAGLGETSPGGFFSVTAADVPGAVGSVYLIPAGDPAPAFGDENRIGIRCGPGRGRESFPRVFDDYGLRLLEGAGSARLLVMDEIGTMEENAERFCRRVEELLDGPVPILGVVQKQGDTPLQAAIRRHPAVRLTEVTPENRDALLPLLLPLIRL